MLLMDTGVGAPWPGSGFAFREPLVVLGAVLFERKDFNALSQG
ncbi:hypothetical protein MED193_06439 [Roseobacter sp. MED193]|nr:hypothetical protein MED193_06439 [Roseobacter sp. MED193]